jgi:hypothetical protein
MVAAARLMARFGANACLRGKRERPDAAAKPGWYGDPRSLPHSPSSA